VRGRIKNVPGVSPSPISIASRFVFMNGQLEADRCLGVLPIDAGRAPPLPARRANITRRPGKPSMNTVSSQAAGRLAEESPDFRGTASIPTGVSAKC